MTTPAVTSADLIGALASPSLAAEPFTAAYARVHSTCTICPSRTELANAGWTADLLMLADRVSRWAQDTGLVSIDADLPAATEAWERHNEYRKLENVGQLFLKHGSLSPADTGPWMTLAAASPTVATRQSLRRLLARMPDGTRQITSWQQAAPASLGAWAWAAGLTVDETAAAYRAGILDLPSLHVLAGLRGFCVPPAT